jgi:hypothetical protein
VDSQLKASCKSENAVSCRMNEKSGKETKLAEVWITAGIQKLADVSILLLRIWCK